MIGPLFERLVLRSDIRGHLERIYEVVVETAAAQVVELGVRTGVSTCALLAAVERTGGRVWSCDVNDPDEPDAVTRHPRWTFRQGDDLVLWVEAPNPIDVLFIDTSHEYEHTLAELRAYTPLVRPGGAVIMHDTDPALWPECAAALAAWLGEDARPTREQFSPHDNGLTVVWL